MKIAIIGTGISGLGAGFLLHRQHDITVYEKNDYIGGHSRTITVETEDGKIPVDTGFIVFNKRNYPLLTGLFKHLNVPVIPSNMSFGVSVHNGWLEYGTQNLLNIIAQKQNLIRPDFWHMIADIVKFNKHAKQFLSSPEDITLGYCLDALGMRKWFRQYYLLAMGGAIWSTPLDKMLEFPAKTFIRFFENHGLLTINDQPQWYTVKGGSREYVKRLTQTFSDSIKYSCGVKHVVRHPDYVEIQDTQGQTSRYDQVIFACHTDQILALLQNPTQEEQSIIQSFRYQPNKAVLHTDKRFMPKRRSAWSSWVYLSEQMHDGSDAVSLTYWMNNLQPLETHTPIFVTLNPGTDPDPALTFDTHIFEHPVFDQSAIHAQAKISDIQGKERIWYCGAWQRYGFHEDGLLSAVNVAKSLGVDVPWT